MRLPIKPKSSVQTRFQDHRQSAGQAPEQRQAWGQAVEREVAELLASQNRQYLMQGYRTRKGELDLLFEETDSVGQVCLVVVEVRARANTDVDPVETVSYRKQMRLIYAIRHFLMGYQGTATTVRIDIVTKTNRRWHHRRGCVLLDC